MSSTRYRRRREGVELLRLFLPVVRAYAEQSTTGLRPIQLLGALRDEGRLGFDAELNWRPVIVDDDPDEPGDPRWIAAEGWLYWVVPRGQVLEVWLAENGERTFVGFLPLSEPEDN